MLNPKLKRIEGPYTYGSTPEGFIVVRCEGNKRIVYATLSRLWPNAEGRAQDVAAGLNLLHKQRNGGKKSLELGAATH